eukprot:TRINITY_DN369_c0_g3_i1.p1 TRINITY_DN369_c0_g3~~TRINITY_DN369_c0_g3_i1.p1  ORF type:complete len:323 (+),score=82.46 TRINITY_DN369_c0_g3_i1:60-1028(+)
MGQSLRRVAVAEAAAEEAQADDSEGVLERKNSFSSGDCERLLQGLHASGTSRRAVREQVLWIVAQVNRVLERPHTADDEYVDEMLWYIGAEGSGHESTPLLFGQVRLILAQHVASITDRAAFLSKSLSSLQQENESEIDMQQLLLRGTPSITLKRHRACNTLDLFVRAIGKVDSSLVTELDVSECHGALNGNEMMVILDRCTGLRVLNVAYWQATSAVESLKKSLAGLERLPLEELDMTAVRISPEALDWLLHELPVVARNLRRLLLPRMGGSLHVPWGGPGAALAAGGARPRRVEAAGWPGAGCGHCLEPPPPPPQPVRHR